MGSKEDELALELETHGLSIEEGSREHRMLVLLFGIRTAVLTNHKQLQQLEEKQNDMAQELESTSSKVARIHDKLMEPDTGLFARVRDVEHKIEGSEEREKELDQAVKHVDRLVDLKSNFGKIIWYVSFTSFGILIKYIFDSWVTKK